MYPCTHAFHACHVPMRPCCPYSYSSGEAPPEPLHPCPTSAAHLDSQEGPYSPTYSPASTIAVGSGAPPVLTMVTMVSVRMGRG